MPATDRKSKSLGPTGDEGRRAIQAAIREYVVENYDLLLERLISDEAEIEAMFAQIDRSLDASERRTERLLGAQA